MKSYIFILSLIFTQVSYAETKLESQFGFSATVQDGWFVLSPQKMADANKNETANSLGISDTVDSRVLNEILESVKGGNIEFYYDKNYINKEYKNHVSAQLSAPLQFRSMDEVTKECEAMPAKLNKLFGEKVNFLSCQLVPSNGRAVFHYAYTVVSQGLTIIQETIPVNQNYSIVFVGGSANDVEGLHRVRAAQQSLVDSVTSYLSTQAKSNEEPNK